jgi:hypothetical protein
MHCIKVIDYFRNLAAFKFLGNLKPKQIPIIYRVILDKAIQIDATSFRNWIPAEPSSDIRVVVRLG